MPLPLSSGRMTVRRAVAFALLIVLAGRGTAAAGGSLPSLPNTGPPLILRLEGSRAPTQAAARAAGFTVASLGFAGDDARLWLGVTDARTVGGDQPLDGKDVLAAVAPFQPNLLVAGAPDLVRALRASAFDTPLVIEGLVLRSSRTYYLRQVRVGGPEGR